MAKKSTEEKVQEQAASTQQVPKNVELPKRELIAHEELAAAPKGTGKSYRLSDPDTQYTEPGTDWTITGDQSKSLVENPSAETLERIKKGFLIEESGE
jgi:hypothetical protein